MSDPTPPSAERGTSLLHRLGRIPRGRPRASRQIPRDLRWFDPAWPHRPRRRVATSFLAQGKWDFTEKTFSTILLAEPYPTLVADHEVYYLVLPNKQGVAVADAAPFNLHTVDILGSVIRDPDQPVAMIAVQGASAITSTGTSSTNPLQLTSTHTTATLRGEIVDSKCAFGAMNFGTLKCHRACAIACLSGDIPPVLVVRHDGGRTATHFLLLNASGKPMNQTALEFAALPIAITGRVTTIGSWNILRADPASIQTLP